MTGLRLTRVSRYALVKVVREIVYSQCNADVGSMGESKRKKIEKERELGSRGTSSRKFGDAR